MSRDLMNYGDLVESALRGVVRSALLRAAREGLPGVHHFYIIFQTDFPGVQIPDYLKAKYPDEMTVVIQHQYDDLDISDKDFGITLSFSGHPERLIVPFASIRKFADPAVPFLLEFESGDEMETVELLDTEEQDEVTKNGKDKPSAAGKVVSLDQFRKK